MGDIFTEAKEFLEQFHSEEAKPEDLLQKRLEEVKREIASTGSWVHTEEELNYGVKLAWRNNAHCIGKVHWQVLKVFDFR